MIEAILALVGAIVGVVGSVTNAAAQKYAQRNAEYEAEIQFQRDKEVSLFSAYNAQQLAKMGIIIAGIAGILFLIYTLNKGKK